MAFRRGLVLLLLFLLGISCLKTSRDIFEGLEAGVTSSKSTAQSSSVFDEEMQTCADDLIPNEALPLEEFQLLGSKVLNKVKEVPKPPPLPDLTLVKDQIVNIFHMPNFQEGMNNLRNMIEQHKKILDTYGEQWLGFFKKTQTEMVEKVKQEIQKQNKEVTAFFNKHLSEFDEVCKPDAEKCLSNIENHLEIYQKKLNENVGACKEFAERQLQQHEQWIKNEQDKLSKPLLAIQGCFDTNRLLSSMASCFGNLISNVISKLTEGLQTFAAAMGSASESLQTRMGKFQSCVVDRKKLLDRGRDKLAAKAAACLEKAPKDAGAGVFSD
ncbi:uncharacterized protein LOC129757204 isoform X2 [Uranotaenia lowii]|uniref:uncharacterized protein LOC129757204 isoform X2 n=1 Tax=Uranotaenia lowii TaxID=190385 RepID=UPI00247ADBE3|nr:uncharacterized protein LOC129757204 isoform X2 [Uranotaenia lowii]